MVPSEVSEGIAASIDKGTAKPENIVTPIDKGATPFGPNVIDFEKESGWKSPLQHLWHVANRNTSETNTPETTAWPVVSATCLYSLEEKMGKWRMGSEHSGHLSNASPLWGKIESLISGTRTSSCSSVIYLSVLYPSAAAPIPSFPAILHPLHPNLTIPGTLLYGSAKKNTGRWFLKMGYVLPLWSRCLNP